MCRINLAFCEQCNVFVTVRYVECYKNSMFCCNNFEKINSPSVCDVCEDANVPPRTEDDEQCLPQLKRRKVED
jgi:hypothetical protein